ncbi:MAG: acetolactate synthase small subunit [Algicola sp.]|nr:acetolactate synthase small subunit [Algicola sp.]
MRQVLTILMENEPGALSNMIGLFSQRALNIESLNVVPTIDRSLSQVTLKTKGDERTVRLIAKQINRLIDVLSVTVLTDHPYIKLDFKPEAQIPEGEVDKSEPLEKVEGYRML